MKHIFMAVFVFTLLGCRFGQKTQTKNDTTSGDSYAVAAIADTTKLSSAKKIESFKGLYISGNELSSFRDCNTGKTYWLEDKSKSLNETYQKTKGILSYPYESIYVEVKGYLNGKRAVGNAEEFENTLIATEIVAAKQKSFSTDCYEFDFIALGNEPFWSLDIIPSEKIIALKDVAANKTHVFLYKLAKTSENRTLYETSNDKDETLKAVITKETCSDGMSDRNYNYSAEVAINGKTLKGCAIKKGDKITMDH